MDKEELATDLSSDGVMLLDLKQGLKSGTLFLREMISIGLHKGEKGLMPHDWHLWDFLFNFVDFFKTAEEVKKHVKCDSRECVSLSNEHLDEVASCYVVVKFSQLDEGS